jgi:acyl CoA:acetate/3-ketoacid CoA transferase beta subunit
MMTHRDRKGNSKIVRECSLPITAKTCVDKIYTDLAVIEITSQGMVLAGIADGISIDEVIAATAAPLIIPDKQLPKF